MIIGAISGLVGAVIFAYVLGRFDSRAECEKLRQRVDKYKDWYTNTHARLEHAQFENDMLRAQLKEVSSPRPSLKDSVRQITF